MQLGLNELKKSAAFGDSIGAEMRRYLVVKKKLKKNFKKKVQKKVQKKSYKSKKSLVGKLKFSISVTIFLHCLFFSGRVAKLRHAD